MGIIDIFSKRQKKERGEMPDVYTYDKLPDKLRIQVVHIIYDVIGTQKYASYGAIPLEDTYYINIRHLLCKEYGMFTLSGNKYAQQDIIDFFLNTDDIAQALDVIEIVFQLVVSHVISNKRYSEVMNIGCSGQEGIEELNRRFNEHAVGYQFQNNNIVKVDSTYMHSEVVKPVLNLLSGDKFLGACDEYMKAHEHYRHGRNKECLAECLKAFESTMKIICKHKKWNYDIKDTASKLIKSCLENGLFQNFTETQLGSLRGLLESGIPTIRNKFGGHGQGDIIQQVDNDLTRYCLNMTGTTIIFLVEQSGIK